VSPRTPQSQDPIASSCANDEPIWSATVPAEARDAFIMGDQRRSKLDGSRDQKSIRRIAVLEMMKLIDAAGYAITQGHRLNAGTLEQTLNPRLNRNVKLNPACIDEQRKLPNRDDAEQDGSAIPPAAVQQSACRGVQVIVAAFKPQSNMRVE
jgi:hypothetical protein